MRNKGSHKKILQKVKDDYNSIAKDFSSTRQKKWNEFDSYLKVLPDTGLLADIGCGNGRFYKFLNQHSKLKYLGIDNSEGLLQKAREENPEAEFKEGDLLKIPCKDNHFDATVCIAALHHIPSQKLRRKAINELKRITKKDGTIIVTVWNLFQKKYLKYIRKAQIRSLLSLGKYESRGTLIPWSDSGIERYYYAYKEKELVKDLESQGLTIEKILRTNNFIAICRKY